MARSIKVLLMKQGLFLASLLSASLFGTVYAGTEQIQQSLKSMGVNNAEIKSSPVAGLQTVFTDNGVLYVTDDGKYVLQGPMFDVSGKLPVNVTNQLLTHQLQQLEPEMIVYKAPKEKYVITVFTDITCGYCRKMHSQMDEYNKLGITIRYLAFPRQGPNSQAEKEMKSIWCVAPAARNKAFDAAMKGEDISSVSCNIDLKKHYELGAQLGVQGTPAIMLSNGMMLPGYQGPKEMLALLDAQSAAMKNTK